MLKKAKTIAAKGRVGLLLRAFAAKPELVEERVRFMRLSVDKALDVSIDGESAIKNVVIIVPSNQERFAGQLDCGQLVSALEEEFKGDTAVTIVDHPTGELFCSATNRGVSLLHTMGCKYVIIASGEANSYWNESTVRDMYIAAAEGARAIFVAIGELQESILVGRGANTFAMWEIEALHTCGGFDLRDAMKPADSKFASYAQGWHKDRGEVYYQFSGVEEIRLSIRMIEEYGQCIAIVMPKDKDGEEQRYEAPTDGESLERHLKKMGTKRERQDRVIYQEDKDPTFSLVRDHGMISQV